MATSVKSTEFTPFFRVMDRETAIQRLHHLVPGSSEHTQLQGALIKKIGITEIVSGNRSYKVDPSISASRLLGGFGPTGLVALGEKIKLQGIECGTPLVKIKWKDVSFGMIMAFAGYCYGVVGEPISLLGGTLQEKEDRFLAAFHKLLDEDNPAGWEFSKIFEEISRAPEYKYIEPLTSSCYSSINCINSLSFAWLTRDIQDLLVDNSDHFSSNAQDAYRIGHGLALEEAFLAGQKGDIEGLRRAYLLDAFACRFLTDLFSSGHVRNQRGELELFLKNNPSFVLDMGEQSASISNVEKELAGILALAQHETDGHDGLNVCNRRGQCWRAYGDDYFFSKKNAINIKMAIEATQQSVDEIYAAYESQGKSKESCMDDYLPFAAEFNPPPLYEVINGELFFYDGAERVQIQTMQEFLDRGLRLASNRVSKKAVRTFLELYLPQLKLRPVQPQIWMKGLWETLGLTITRQMQQNAQISEQMNEAPESIRSMSCAVIHTVSGMLDNLESFQDLKETIKYIKSQLEFVNKKNEPRTMEAFWNLYIQLEQALLQGTTENGTHLLHAYMERLKNQIHPMDERGIRRKTTSKFKQLLDAEVRSFSLYGVFRLELYPGRETQNLLQDQIQTLQKNMAQQIDANKEWIELDILLDLIDQSSGYPSHLHDESEYRSPLYSSSSSSEFPRFTYSGWEGGMGWNFG